MTIVFISTLRLSLHNHYIKQKDQNKKINLWQGVEMKYNRNKMKELLVALCFLIQNLLNIFEPPKIILQIFYKLTDMSGPLRHGFHDLLIAMHMDYHAKAR